MIRNRIRRDLDEQGFTIGSWLNLASPLAAEIMAMAGFSWLAIDAEHAPIGISEVVQQVRAIESRGATAVVRVPNHNPDTIGQALDAGAMGIVAPHVRTVGQARQIADACRLPPRGRRSSGTTRAATRGGEYLKWFNDEVVLFAQIEEREGVENAEAIAQVEGIDVMFLGPNDLSADMGLARDAPEVEQAMRRVLAAACRAGKPAGIPVSGVDAINKWRSEGFTVLTLSSDFRLLQSAAATQLHDVLGKR